MKPEIVRLDPDRQLTMKRATLQSEVWNGYRHDLFAVGAILGFIAGILALYGYCKHARVDFSKETHIVRNILKSAWYEFRHPSPE